MRIIPTALLLSQGGAAGWLSTTTTTATATTRTRPTTIQQPQSSLWRYPSPTPSSSPRPRRIYSSCLSSLTALYGESLLQFDHESIDLAESEYTQVLIKDDLPCASATRENIEKLFNDPRQPSGERFVWDPWFVNCGEGKDGEEAPLPGDSDDYTPVEGERETAASQIQYSLTRAQCNNVLSEDNFETLVEEITQLGRSIGCAAITPPWISMYSTGDQQNFHTDSTQGPMAYTFSISKGYGQTFWGGETMILTPNVLDYWRDLDTSLGTEAPSIVRYLPPTFGRFTAFDGRVPHGVQPVHCPRGGPLESRIVIHGWFAQPETIWTGDLADDDEAQSTLDTALADITNNLFGETGEVGRVIGYLAIRLDISSNGEVTEVTSVCDTLQADPSDFRGVVGYDEEGREVLEDAVADIKLTLREALGQLSFPESSNRSSVVVPFDFF